MDLLVKREPLTDQFALLVKGEPHVSLTDQFALLSVVHSNEADLEAAREAFLASLPQNNEEAKELRVILLQQKLSRYLRERPADAPKVVEELRKAMNVYKIHSNVLNLRTKLLIGGASENEMRTLFFNDVAARFPGAADLRSDLIGVDSSASSGLCKNGHPLIPFQTPNGGFSCDKCGVRFPQGTLLFSCRACDFDICASDFVGNSQFGAVRPRLDLVSTVSQCILSAYEGSENMLSLLKPNVLGFLIATAADAIFDPVSVDPSLAALSQACIQVFSVAKLKGRMMLRRLLSADLYSEKASIAMACASRNGENVLSLILQDLKSGFTQEDNNHGLYQQTMEHSVFSVTSVLTVAHIKRLGQLQPFLLSSDWYATSLAQRIVPSEDDSPRALLQDGYISLASIEDCLELLDKFEELANHLRPHKRVLPLDMLILHHRIKLDRMRRKPLLPTSSSLPASGKSEMNADLLTRYLSLGHQLDFRPSSEEPREPYERIQHDSACGVLRQFFKIPTRQDDELLLRAELFDLFAWKVATVQTFERYFSTGSHFLRSIYHEATASSTITPADEAHIAFCDFNAKWHTLGDAVELYCDFKNLRGPLSVKVFEINLKQLYRTTKSDINAAIELEGLIPNTELVISHKAGAGQGREVIRLFSDKAVSGCYVVEVAADGVAARAIIRKGAVRLVQRTEPYGHVFYPVDTDARPMRPLQPGTQKVELWVDGKVFQPERMEDGSFYPDGRIVLPFLDEKANSNQAVVVLTCEDDTGSRSQILKFNRRKNEMVLECKYFVDREALVSGNRTAQLVIRPALSICDVPAPLSFLEEYSLTITLVDASGVRTEENLPIRLDELRFEIIRKFKVIPNLVQVQVRLVAKQTQSGVLVSARDTLNISGLNTQASTPLAQGLYMRPRPNGTFEVLLLGRTGEPVDDVPLSIQFETETSQNPIGWMFRTDAHGAIDLGDLSGVERVVCSTKGQSRVTASFKIPSDYVSNLVSSVRSLASDPVQYIHATKSPLTSLRRTQFKLVSRTPEQQVVEDLTSKLSMAPSGMHVYVQGLSPGAYVFEEFAWGSTTRINITVAAAGEANPMGMLRIPIEKGSIFVADASELSHPVAIQSAIVSAQTGVVQVVVAGGSTNKRRVHLITRTFLASGNPERRLTSESLGSSLALSSRRIQAALTPITLSRAMYVEKRKLGDEMMYCAERKDQFKVSTNMLPMASQLIFPRDIGETVTHVLEAQQGTSIVARSDHVGVMKEGVERVQKQSYSFGAAQAPVAFARSTQSSSFIGQSLFGGSSNMRQKAMPQASMDMMSSSGVQSLHPMQPYLETDQAFDHDNTLDFLSNPSVIITNLVPDPLTGQIQIQLDQEQARCSWIEVVVTDDDGSAASKSLQLPFSSSVPLDLRHRSNLPLDSHLIETQVVRHIEAGTKFAVGNLATSKFAVLDDIDSFVKFAIAMSPEVSSNIEPVRKVLTDWPKLSPQVKAKLYYSQACHELNLFLKRRDPDFFATVIRPNLLERPRSSMMFMDAFLLEEDLSAFSTVEAASRLLMFERALLAVRLKDSMPELSLQILRGLETSAKDFELNSITRRGEAFQIATLTSKTSDAVGDAVRANAYAADGEQLRARRIIQSDEAEDDDNQDDASFNTIEENAAAPLREVQGESELEMVGRMSKVVKRDRYKEIGPAHAWNERFFIVDSTNQSVYEMPMNAIFWFEFVKYHVDPLSVEHGSGFLSPYVCLARNTGITEALMMLSVLDAPWSSVLEAQPHVYHVRREANELDFVPSHTCILFHQQVAPVAEPLTPTGAATTMFVSQTLFNLTDVAGMSEQARRGVEKEPVQLVKGKQYVARTVVTNASNETLRVKILTQIPDGTIPLCAVEGQGDRLPSKSLERIVPPFSTIKEISPVFYFPVQGEFGWFPAHVSKSEFGDNRLLAYAPPRVLAVNDRMTVVDETLWKHVCSKEATIDQVCSFLSTRPMIDVELSLVCWRFVQQPLEQVGKNDWIRVSQTLAARGVYSCEVAVFGLIHDSQNPASAGRAVVELMLRTSGVVSPVSLFGSYFDSMLYKLDADDVSNTFTRLEFASSMPEVFPIVNARAHPLASVARRGRVSPNDRVVKVHKSFMMHLCYQSRPLSWDNKMKLILILLEEGRIAMAKRVMRVGCIPPRPTAQTEYLKIFLEFYIDDPGADVRAIALRALETASRYLEHPNPNWREKFVKTVRVCKKILNHSTSLDDQEIDDATMSDMASRAPSFEAELAADKSSVQVWTKNFQANTEMTMNMYKMNLEHVFSTKPFSVVQDAGRQELGHFAFVAPNKKIVIQPAGDGSNKAIVPLPKELLKEDVLIQVVSGSQQRVFVRFASSMSVKFVEDFGILQVLSGLDSQPVILAYVKVYAKLANGAVMFFKDGYTDIRGEFDYCSLNTTRSSTVTEFSVLVSHPELGAIIRKVVPPSV